VSPNCSVALQLGTPWHGAPGMMHSRGCLEDGHHRSLWHLRVVANARMHTVGAWRTFVAQLFGGHAIGDTMAWCNRSVALARMLCEWSPSMSLAFAGGRQRAHAHGWGGAEFNLPNVWWPRSCGHHGMMQQVHCTRASSLGMVTIDLFGICGWSPTRACTRLGRGGLQSSENLVATQLWTPWHGATGPLHLRGCLEDGHHRSLWHLRVVAHARMHAVGASWTCVAQ